jgi:hypothetical protein
VLKVQIQEMEEHSARETDLLTEQLCYSVGSKDFLAASDLLEVLYSSCFKSILMIELLVLCYVAAVFDIQNMSSSDFTCRASYKGPLMVQRQF